MLSIAAVPAMAADAPSPALKVSGSVALVSDYRFRGVSQSNNGLAVQGGLTLNHESG
ncbi:TorF family putative porin, partial [Sandarakinorhabdus sp. DWP1-3-1]|uniref:TorF family putative porin n=1 Tax=Sandarakinorhabdus sp. DWP1-3-1 TaxID=2804627 RepID=UPI003CF164DC